MASLRLLDETLHYLWTDSTLVWNLSGLVEKLEITKVVLAVGRSDVNWFAGRLN